MATSPDGEPNGVANRVFAGALDEIAVYSGTALTAQQVAWIYWAR